MKTDSYKSLSAAERKAAIARNIEEARTISEDYIKKWEPTNCDWKTIGGIAYLRLSDDSQVLVEKGSLEQQVHIAMSEAAIRSNSERINYKITKIFIEPGITGTHDRRPEFKRMKKEIGLGHHRFVVIKELSRIARETHLWLDFFNLCIASECEVVIRNFPFNPNDPAQVLQINLMASFAEYESKQISRRTRESNFSAMITSGKFNATRPVLGFDPIESHGRHQVGFYSLNDAEVKSVVWIMNTFIKYASHQKTLEEIQKRGLLTKAGKPFAKHSLYTLLSNKIYIGKWELNSANKHKLQSRLMPYDQYKEVDLPNGPVIDLKLWEGVQQTLKQIAGKKAKNTCITRVYPLSGLIFSKDGKSFHGNGAHGRSGPRKNYYYNGTHKIRLAAEVIEDEAAKIVGDLIRKTPKLEAAIKKYGSELKDSESMLETAVLRMKSEIEHLNDKRAALDKRLDFIINSGDEVFVDGFRTEYLREVKSINAEIDRLRQCIEATKSQKNELSDKSFDWSDIGKRSEEVQRLLMEKDPVALKNAYKKLFKRIVVGEIDKHGVRSIDFLVNDGEEYVAVMKEDSFTAISKEWGGQWGLNPRMPESQSGALTASP